MLYVVEIQAATDYKYNLPSDKFTKKNTETIL